MIKGVSRQQKKLSWTIISFSYQRCYSRHKAERRSSNTISRNKLEWREQRVAEEGEFYHTESLSKMKASTPENQYIRDAIAKCTSNNEIMQLVDKFHYIEDETIFTKAIQQLTALNHHNLKTGKQTLSQIQQIWDMLPIRDVVQYNALLQAFNLLRFERRSEEKFKEMLRNEVRPNIMTLTIMLQSFRREGKIERAKRIWNLIVGEFRETPDALAYSTMIAVCAMAKDKVSAEHYFEECPFKTSYNVCWRMIIVYAEIRDFEGVDRMKSYMIDNDVVFTTEIYNALGMANILAQRSQNAIDILLDGVDKGHWDLTTMKHLAGAVIDQIGIETDYERKMEMLSVLEVTIPGYCRDEEHCGKSGTQFISGHRWAQMVFQARVKVHGDTFGSDMFEEFIIAYPALKYWADHCSIPTLDFHYFDFQQAQIILDFVFRGESYKFKDSGLHMLLNENHHFKFRKAVSKQDLVLLINTKYPYLQVTEKSSNILSIDLVRL